MRFRRKHYTGARVAGLLPPHPRRAALSAGWREGAALAAGFLVMLVTTLLIWAALAEAALALAEAG